MPNVRLRRVRDVSTFRRLAVAAWRPSRDPSIHGSLELDATAALAYLEAVHARTGQKVTLTHLVGRAVAVALRERPQVSMMIRRQRFYARRDVDIFFQVALAREAADARAYDLSGIVIRNADRKSTAAIAREFGARVEAVRADRDPELAGLRRALARVPPLLLRPLYTVLDVLQYSFNLRLPGLPRDPFGAAMVTNVGMFGVRWAYPPLFPPAHCPIVILVGAVTLRPWVVHTDAGPRVEPRPVLPLHATFDHRVLDGVEAARFGARIEALLEAPGQLDVADGAGAEIATP